MNQLRKFPLMRAHGLKRQQDELATSLGETTVSLIQIYKALGGGWQIRLQVSFLFPQ